MRKSATACVFWVARRTTAALILTLNHYGDGHTLEHIDNMPKLLPVVAFAFSRSRPLGDCLLTGPRATR